VRHDVGRPQNQRRPGPRRDHEHHAEGTATG
jgi:hypothetical protein